MIIRKGNVLRIRHIRKGVITVIAVEDFDPADETFYPVVAADAVNGVKTVKKWLPGDRIPCRRSLCDIMEVLSQN